MRSVTSGMMEWTPSSVAFCSTSSNFSRLMMAMARCRATRGSRSTATGGDRNTRRSSDLERDDGVDAELRRLLQHELEFLEADDGHGEVQGDARLAVDGDGRRSEYTTLFRS